MSHHLDSPVARQDIRLDITDRYVFAGQTGTVFVINVCPSLGGDVAVPGFHPEGRYEFKIDLDGDAAEDITYRVSFGAADAAGAQAFSLERIPGTAAADPFAGATVHPHWPTPPIANGWLLRSPRVSRRTAPPPTQTLTATP